jgi:hypothetical protein
VPYLVNEHTPNSEVFVPSRSGAILNVPQAQAALRGAAGGGAGGGAGAASGHLAVSIGFDEGAKSMTAMVRNEAGQLVAQAVQAYDKALPGRFAAIQRNPRGR